MLTFFSVDSTHDLTEDQAVEKSSPGIGPPWYEALCGPAPYSHENS